MKNSNVVMPFKDSGHRHQSCLRSALSAAEETCFSRGTRLTRLRRRVLELVWSSHEPVKAYDILGYLKDEDFCSAPPTVYRALGFLQAEGLVHKIESLNSYVGCGRPQERHISQFLICNHCGSVAEMDDPDIRALLSEKVKQLGFNIDHEMVEIKGICSACSVGPG